MIGVGAANIPITVTITDSHGTVVDLTGGTVQIQYRLNNGARVTASMTVSAPTTGVATYILPSTAFSQVGELAADFKVTLASGLVNTTSPTLTYQIDKGV